jgi:AcrR family transcriptional regulator
MEHLSARKRQAIAKKLHITETAMSLFREKGYGSVKVTEICKEANISLGTFYHYFSSKDSIIDDSYQAIDSLVFERIDNLEFPNPYAKLLGILEQSALVMQEELGYLFISQSYHQILSSKTKYSFSHERSLFRILEATVTEGIEKGCFWPDTDPQEISELCLRIGRGDIIDWCLQEGSYQLNERVVKDLKLILHSFIIC